MQLTGIENEISFMKFSIKKKIIRKSLFNNLLISASLHLLDVKQCNF